MPATAASRLGKKVGRCMVSPCCSMVKDLCTAYDGGAGPGGGLPIPAAGGAPSGGTAPAGERRGKRRQSAPRSRPARVTLRIHQVKDSLMCTGKMHGH